MNWDDIRLFLALSRSDNIRDAANRSGVSYSTVSRRIDAFEHSLSVRLFDRFSTGFVLTASGEELLELAEKMEEQVLEADRRIFGQETTLAGQIKLSMVDAMATDLLMPDLTEFTKLYPEIALEIDIGYSTADLSRREADLALRFAHNPPEDLLGRKLVSCGIAPYATQNYIDLHNLKTEPTGGQWIGYKLGDKIPDWVCKSPFPKLPFTGQILSMNVQKEACKSGMGIAMLPCFTADPDPVLIRIGPVTTSPRFDLWLLKHTDMRSNARVRVLSDFLIERIKRHRALLTGARP
ncbi:MAG: LysR family transcriptional regulator [Amylibacter sp.]|nr:LysR family transcriptional regulator [Amylibacter sp.]